MPSLPSEFLAVILPYARLFCHRVFAHVQVLLAGAILAPGKRTITCMVPEFDGMDFSPELRAKLWDKYYTAAPEQRRPSGA